jgi:hypothetical protein
MLTFASIFLQDFLSSSPMSFSQIHDVDVIPDTLEFPKQSSSFIYSIFSLNRIPPTFFFSTFSRCWMQINKKEQRERRAGMA